MTFRLSIILLCLLYGVTCHAQFDKKFDRKDNQKGTKTKKDTSTVSLPKTSIFRYKTIEDRHKFIEYVDTSLAGFQIYDPTYYLADPHLNLGNMGSSNHRIRYRRNQSYGTNYGYYQYDLYKIDGHNFRFFENNRPLNDLYFSPLGGVQNFKVKSLFARPFSNGVHLTLDYQRLNQDGFYRNQMTKSTNLGLGISYKKKKYELLFNLFVNNNDEEFNGGISEDASELETNSNFDIRSNVPVNTDDAIGRQEEAEIQTNQYFDIIDQDSSRWCLKLHHKFSYRSGSFRFSDDNVSSTSDSISYLEFRVEDRGIRSSFAFRKLSNHFNAILNNKENLNWSVGLEHSYERLEFPVETDKINSVFLHSSLKSKLGKSLQSNTNAVLGLIEYSGDFNLRSRLTLDIKKWGKLSGEVSFYRYTPSIIHRKYSVSEISIWDQSLNKPIGSTLKGTLDIPLTRSSISIGQTVERNSIYTVANTFIPVQNDNNFTATHIDLTQHVSLYKFHYRGDLMYQLFSEDLYALPTLTTKQSLYFEGKIFKKRLHLQLGVDYRFMVFDRALRFSPTNGQFYPSASEGSVENLSLMDWFINFKISKLRVFVKMENALDLFQQQTQFLIQDYPGFDNKLRLGVRWILKD